MSKSPRTSVRLVIDAVVSGGSTYFALATTREQAAVFILAVGGLTATRWVRNPNNRWLRWSDGRRMCLLGLLLLLVVGNLALSTPSIVLLVGMSGLSAFVLRPPTDHHDGRC